MAEFPVVFFEVGDGCGENWVEMGCGGGEGEEDFGREVGCEEGEVVGVGAVGV